VISIFHGTKIPKVDIKVQVYSKFKINEIWKNVKSPISMGNGNLTLPNLGASFKKWGCSIPILPKAMAHSPNFKKKNSKNSKKFKKMGIGFDRAKCQPGPIRPYSHFFEFFFPLALHFLRMWSTLVGWLQYMPTLPRLLLKTSNTHNFWSVAPKIMKFIFMRSFFWDIFGKFFFK
jgi:hypothetical protein